MARRAKSEASVDGFSEKQAKAEHARLETEIAEHDRRYYQDDAPSVSDAEYDALRRRYNAIEARFPDLRTLQSLTQRVGAAPTRRDGESGRTSSGKRVSIASLRRRSAS